MEALYITGHQNPDTDSIVAAISYASLKRQIGEPDAVPVRLGNIGTETAFVLDRFGFEQPMLLSSARTQLRDMDFDLPKTVTPDVTLRKAWEAMLSNKLYTLPITDGDGHLVGLCSSSDITDFEMSITGREHEIRTTQKNLCDTLSAWKVSGEDRDIEGKLEVVVSDRDFASCDGQILIAEWREGMELIASHSGAAAVILCHGYNACKTEGNTPVYATPFDIFTATRLVTQSVPVNLIMRSDNLVTFYLDDYADDVLKLLITTRHRSYPILNADGRVVGAISRVHMINHKRKRLVLVDHNEKSQSVPGIEQAEVVEIIDHHRLGDVQTSTPIYFRNEAVGSTTTIIANMYVEHGITPSPQMAGLMLAGILSDTVLFKSPTSTAKDRQTADSLAKLAEQDAATLGKELFSAITGALRTKTPDELLFYDFKEYSLGGKKLGVGQITCERTDGLPVDGIQREMNKLQIDERFDMIVFMETDIEKNGSYILHAGGDVTDLLSAAFGVDKADPLFLPGVMSRKKQLVPALSVYLM